MSELRPQDCAALRELADRLWELSSHTDLGALLVAQAVAAERELKDLEQLSSDRWLEELRRDRPQVRRELEDLAEELEQRVAEGPGAWDWYQSDEEADRTAKALRNLLVVVAPDGVEDRAAQPAPAPTPPADLLAPEAVLGLVAGVVAGESESVRKRVLTRLRAALQAWQG